MKACFWDGANVWLPVKINPDQKTQLFGAADLVGKSDHEKDQPSVG